MNTHLAKQFKVGQRVYIKPNAKEILSQIDKEYIALGHITLGWSYEMDDMEGSFHVITDIRTPTDDYPGYRIGFSFADDRWSFYPECLDSNVKTANL